MSSNLKNNSNKPLNSSNNTQKPHIAPAPACRNSPRPHRHTDALRPPGPGKASCPMLIYDPARGVHNNSHGECNNAFGAYNHAHACKIWGLSKALRPAILVFCYMYLDESSPTPQSFQYQFWKGGGRGSGRDRGSPWASGTRSISCPGLQGFFSGGGGSSTVANILAIPET